MIAELAASPTRIGLCPTISAGNRKVASRKQAKTSPIRLAKPRQRATSTTRAAKTTAKKASGRERSKSANW